MNTTKKKYVKPSIRLVKVFKDEISCYRTPKVRRKLITEFTALDLRK